MPSYSSPSLSHLSIDKLHEKRAFHLEVIRLARIDLRNLREGTEDADNKRWVIQDNEKDLALIVKEIESRRTS
jgi:hypothetical protein